MTNRIVQSTIAILASALVLSEAKAQTELRASVDRSEWTPPQNLVLKLTTGRYVITPPAEGWPTTRPRPVERRGRLEGDNLRMTRALARKAFQSGLTDKKCEARNYSRDDRPVSNAIGPMTLALTDGRITQTSLQARCRTNAADTLFDHVTRLFDHRFP